MSKILTKWISILLTFALVLVFIPVLHNEVKAVSINQQNIADRADFFYNTTWVCQKDVNAWRDEFIFRKGETYHLPYGQPVNSGKFIGYGVELEDFLMAASDADSVFYSTQSEFNGWTSVYYATDCAAFVAMCWGTVRQDCSTLPYYSTYKGKPTEANVHSILQLGDALDSTSVGHVVLVSDLIYNDNGELVQIEITEQTPPQLKRTYFTPEELAAKYGEEFGIYRYEGSVPAVPEWGYATECTNYAAHCSVKITENSPIMSLPCTSANEADSTKIGTAVQDQSYTATRLYRNTADELWYRIDLSNDEVGYIAAEHTIYQGMLLDDISLTDAVYPNAHVKGKTFSLVGNIYSKYNQLVTATGYIYQGFGITSTPKTGGTDYVTGNAYTLKNSNIDYATSFGDLSAGNYTMAYSTTYRNYFVENGDVIENTGTLELSQEFFMVVTSATNQNNCNHRYEQTVLSEGSCTQTALSVFACASCGSVYKESSDAPDHQYGEWKVTAATCTQDGIKTRSCSICGDAENQIIKAIGHDYCEEFVDGTCLQSPHYNYTCSYCADHYTIYPEAVMTPWQENYPEGVDSALIQTKTQYRSSELETILSTEKELEGYAYAGETWETTKTDTINYVKQFPSGFEATNELYSHYHNMPAVGSETETKKLLITSDNVTGYLYYHWCYSNSYFSQASKGGKYTTFHAYYSTINPDTYRVDTSDWSYCTSHELCSNTDWFFVVEVNTQTTASQTKMYYQTQWKPYSAWTDIPLEGSDTLKVETRVLYRYPDLTSTDHHYETSEIKATCNTDGSVTDICTVCGDIRIQTIPSTGHNYDAIATLPNCLEEGYTTYTCACGDSYISDRVEPLGHNYRQITVDATCIVDGYTTEICNVCNDTRVDTIPATGHHYDKGNCTKCGAAEPSQITTPILTLKAPTLEFKDTICIVAFYTAENTEDVIEMGMITYKEKVSVWNVETADHIIPGASYDTASGRYYSSSQGIHAKYLADNIYLACYAKLIDGSYVYTQLAPYSPITYAKSQLKNSNDIKLKQLVVAMLNYGTEAQVYFGHNIENLANASLTAEQATFPEIYREDMVQPVAAVSAQKQGTFVSNKGFSQRKPAISFEGAFCINYFFTPTYAPIDGITLYYWNNKDFNSSTILTPDNATGLLKLDETTSGQYRGDITGISAKNISEATYVAAVYSDGNTTWNSGVLGYSIGTYCSSQIAKGSDIADLAMAAAIYGYHAKQYFG